MADNSDNNAKYKSLFNGEKRVKDFEKRSPLKIVNGYEPGQLMQTNAEYPQKKGIVSPKR